MRIVSLLPSTTELVSALGLEHQLVGISHECDYPTSITNLPKLTSSIIPHGLSQVEIDRFVREAVQQGKSLYSVDAQLLQDLKPDIILTQGLCDVCAVTPTTIETSLRGVRCSVSSDTTIISTLGTSIEGIFEDILNIARATDRLQFAKERIEYYKTKLRNTPQLLSSKSILGLEWVDPYFSAGHWVPEQLISIGGTSAIGSPTEHSRTLTADEIIESNPDVIVVLCCGFDLQKNIEFAQKVYQDERLQHLDAVQKEQVWAIDANSFCSRPTLRVIDGAHVLAKALNGEPNTESIQRVRAK